MKEYDVIVIGGSAAGIPAAITVRRHYPDKNVLIIRKEKQVSIPCGIPYIYGTVGSPDKNLIPDAVLEKNKIELMINEVNAINRQEKSIALNNGEIFFYKKLILATGSKPIVPSLSGVNLENVFSVKKDVDYLSGILNRLTKAKDLVIIGGGFIGVEFAEECNKNREINVTIVEMLPYCLNVAYDQDACEVAETQLKEQGIKVLTNERVVEIKGEQRVKSVKLESGKEIKADMVILGIGAQPNVDLAEKSGLDVDTFSGGIIVDKFMMTSDNNIFACGDCTCKSSFFTQKSPKLMLASIATTEARIAGANVFGLNRENPGTIGAFSTVLNNMAFAVAGLTEEVATELGYSIIKGEISGPNRHPGGMPGMMNLTVKLIFNKETKIIIGGQLFGAYNAGEMINVVSACIQSKMTVEQIALFQTATHPALTASPIAYHLVNAAEMAIKSTK